VWLIKEYQFPYIKLIVKDLKNNPSIGLLLNLRNYNYLPPSIYPMNIGFKRFLNLKEVPGIVEGSDKRPHVVFNEESRRVWFCTPGTYEYHFLYREDPWEYLRYTPQGTLLSILDSCINLIDRKKFNPVK
jgi:hypothetical protein